MGTKSPRRLSVTGPLIKSAPARPSAGQSCAHTGDLMEMTEKEKQRVFNLGYYTWVEQRGLSVEEFECRRSQEWWKKVHSLVPKWDALIKEFNASTHAQSRL